MSRYWIPLLPRQWVLLWVVCVCNFVSMFVCKGRVKVTWIYIAPSRETSKALRHGSHSFTCKLHHACLYLVSVHQMALPLTCDNVRLIAAYYSSIEPERMKGCFGLIGWPIAVYPHKWSSVSCRSSLQDRESSPVKDRRSTAVPHATNHVCLLATMQDNNISLN